MNREVILEKQTHFSTEKFPRLLGKIWHFPSVLDTSATCLKKTQVCTLSLSVKVYSLLLCICILGSEA